MARKTDNAPANPTGTNTAWDRSSHEAFIEYYQRESQTLATRHRFASLRDAVLRVIESNRGTARRLEVADIGCGAGTQSIMWSELGHTIHGIDINLPLIELARRRAADANLTIGFRVGSADNLPWENESMDVCLVPELLEHVPSWQTCLDECARILKHQGILLLTTTNKLCPRQMEFNLPMYSWYPGPLKRYFERLAVTTSPNLANYARYPAVNWFSFYCLRDALAQRGFRSMDHFDVMDLAGKRRVVQMAIAAVRRIALLRWLAHVTTPYTFVVAVKEVLPAK